MIKTPYPESEILIGIGGAEVVAGAEHLAAEGQEADGKILNAE